MRLPTKRDIINSKPYRKMAEWANTTFVAKIICMLFIWLVVSIPFVFYLLVRWGVGPEGFWQELAMMVVAIMLIGWLQGLLLFFGIIASLQLLLGDL